VRVKLRQNLSLLWIIVSTENDGLAWAGSRWVPIDRDGISLSEVKVAHFATAEDAVAYAQSIGFEIEHG
jgi:hypothetical protein